MWVDAAAVGAAPRGVDGVSALPAAEAAGRVPVASQRRPAVPGGDGSPGVAIWTPPGEARPWATMRLST